MQATSTDILGFLIDLPGNFSQAGDGIFTELDVQLLGLHQGTVLLG